MRTFEGFLAPAFRGPADHGRLWTASALGSSLCLRHLARHQLPVTTVAVGVGQQIQHHLLPAAS
jgi:lipid-A-disaccharide synthase-like uncharacterized protein